MKKLSERQVQALTECLHEALHGLGIVDDCDEILDEHIKYDTPKIARRWAQDWDIAIQFVKDNSKHFDLVTPWVETELNRQLLENSNKTSDNGSTVEE